MAHPRHTGLDDRDYWSAIVAGFLELVIACLVLVTAGVSLLASKLIKIFDLPYPCTYFGLQHERSVLCEQHRRLAMLNLRLHESCEECLREITAQSSRVLPLFREQQGSVKELDDGGSIEKASDQEHEEHEEVGDGSGNEEIACMKLPSPRATGDRCVKRKFAKVFVEHQHDQDRDQVPIDAAADATTKPDDEKEKNDSTTTTTTDVSVDSVKAAFQAEKDALKSLYVELEEERNASAIAANEAMAMITRLQEEKAAVQMEARQYQRMVEEKAEYDQEAITLLKEILFKREQEKFVLEKEVESYRKRMLPGVDDDVDDWDDKLSSRLLLLEGGGGGDRKKPYELQGTNLLDDFDLASSHRSGSSSPGGDDGGFLRRNPSSTSLGAGSGAGVGDDLLDRERDREDEGGEKPGEGLSNGNSDLDLRTSSMVVRDNFRLAMQKDIRELTSRLQVLEDDRMLLTQVVHSLTADKPDQLRELAQHFRFKQGSMAAPVASPPPASQVLGCCHQHECILTS